MKIPNRSQLQRGIERGTLDPNVQIEGYPLLHLLIDRQDFEAASLVLACGANPTSKDKDGDRPIHLAAKAGCYELVDALLRAGANPSARGSLRQTLLHFSVLADDHGLFTTAQILRMGLDLEARDRAGQTPLALAVRNSASGQAVLLLAAGADPNAQDRRGSTPIDYVEDLMRYLRSLGAKGVPSKYLSQYRAAEDLGRMLRNAKPFRLDRPSGVAP